MSSSYLFISISSLCHFQQTICLQVFYWRLLIRGGIWFCILKFFTDCCSLKKCHDLVFFQYSLCCTENIFKHWDSETDGAQLSFFRIPVYNSLYMIWYCSCWSNQMVTVLLNFEVTASSFAFIFHLHSFYYNSAWLSYSYIIICLFPFLFPV